LRKNHGLLKAI